jgi:hypothetical protein
MILGLQTRIGVCFVVFLINIITEKLLAIQKLDRWQVEWLLWIKVQRTTSISKDKTD